MHVVLKACMGRLIKKGRLVKVNEKHTNGGKQQVTHA